MTTLKSLTIVAARPRSTDMGRMRVIASLPREGRVERQARRAFVSNGARPLSMSELREWCYCGRKRQHWFYINIKRALRRLGARRIGRSGRAAVYEIPRKLS
jgi:hypothetical protein